jgi:hypothetical protein
MSFVDTTENSEWVRYFAYSLHMDPHFLKRLGIRVHSYSLGILTGYRLSFDVVEDEFFTFEKRGQANIIPQSQSEVEGVVYCLNLSDLPKLDLECGVSAFRYYRKKVQVFTDKWRHCTALTYAAWPDVTSKGLLPSEKYLEQLVTAASKCRVSPKFRQWLSNHPTTF